MNREQYRVIIDPLSFFCIFACFLTLGILIFNLLPDLEQPIVRDIVFKSGALVVLLSGGLVALLFSGLYSPFQKGHTDFILDAPEIDTIIIWTGVDLMMIFFINYITFRYSPLFQSVAGVDPGSLMRIFFTFSLCSGWVEEVVFRGFLLRFLQWFTGGNDVAAILISTSTWWGFHWGVYALEFEPALIILFSGAFLCISMIAADGRLSVPMVPHGLNNIFAWASQGVFYTRITTILRMLAK